MAAYAVGFFLAGSLLLVAALRVLPAPTSAFMLHQHIDDWVEGKGYRPISQRWVSRERISAHAFHAVVASEDQLFYQHNGFDVDAIGKASTSIYAAASCAAPARSASKWRKTCF
nr:transglycosylase domain-containing protein [Methylomonas koyamae]